MQTIEIKNVGPIKELTLDVPAAGVVVFQGRNGAGKTSAIAAVESAITGKGALEVRDGALNGSVDAFGVTLTIGRSTRRKGELEVQSLEGKLSISELIDPGLKSPDAADSKRIKALCSLAGAKPDAELFAKIIDRPTFDATVTGLTLSSPDIITLAERIKRDFESEARRKEDQAEKHEGQALGLKNAAEGIDVEAEADEKKLTANLETAIRSLQSLETQAEQAKRSKEQSETARAELAKCEATADPLHDCQVDEVAKEAHSHEMAESVDKLRKELAAMESKAATARAEYAAAIARRKAAEQSAATLAKWRAKLDEAAIEAPAAGAIDDAKLTVDHHRKAVEQGAMIRRAKESLTQSEMAMITANAHRRQSIRLREAGKATDEVLSGIVASLGTSLRVQAGRLVLTTGRGDTFFDDLSAGERAVIAVDIAIEQLGEHSVLTLSQEIWEGLDVDNRERLANHAIKRGVVILTAEATFGNLTAETFA